MERHPDGLVKASRIVSIALHKPMAEAKEMYEYVAFLARALTGTATPLVFWRKWVSTPGVERIVPVHGTESWFGQYRVNEATGKRVVFVEGPNRNVADVHDHTLYGVAAVRDAGAAQVGLVTARRHFTDMQLDTLRALDWVLVSDRLDDQQERIDRIAHPGRVREFPDARGHACYRSDWRPETPISHPAPREHARSRLALA